MNFAANLDRQVASVVRERGARAILRRVTMSVGPAPLPSPPLWSDAVLESAVLAGMTVLDIQAKAARGIIKLGDILLIAGVDYPVAADVQSRPLTGTPGFSSIQVGIPLVDLPAGEPVFLRPASDVVCHVIINAFPRRLVDGTLIQAADVDILLPALGVSEPTVLDRIIINGRERSIVSVSPVYAQENIIQYRIQAR